MSKFNSSSGLERVDLAVEVGRFLLEILGGSFTGYFTNTLAIKMLFQKYGPLGGVILKTKEKFIENISRLVEKDIINAHTLEKELHRPEMKAIFTKMSNHFINQSLYIKTRKLTVNEIPAFEQTVEQLKALLLQNEQPLEESLVFFLERLKPASIIGEKQLQYLLPTLFQEIIEVLKEGTFIDEILVKLTEPDNRITIGEILTPATIDQLRNNLVKLTGDIHLHLPVNFSVQTVEYLNYFYQKVGMTDILQTSEENCKTALEKSLITTGKHSTNLNKRLKHFFQSEAGELLLNDFTAELFNQLKKNKTPVTLLLGEQLEERVIDFLNEHLPWLIRQLLNWLNNSKKEFEAGLNQAIEESLAAEAFASFNLQALIKKTLYRLFKDRVSPPGIITDKIIDYLEKKIDLETLSRQISSQLIDFLRHQETGEIIGTLEKNKFINQQEIGARLREYLLNYLEQNDQKFFNKLSEKLVNWVKATDFTVYFEQNHQQALFKGIVDNYLEQKSLPNRFAHLICRGFARLKKTKVAQLLEKQDLKQTKTLILDYLVTNQQMLLEQGYRLYNLFREKKLSQPTIGQITKYIKNWLKKVVVIPTKKNYPLSFILAQFKKGNPDDRLGKLLLKLLGQNLSSLLEGRIAGAVSANLNQVSDHDLQVMVKDFMGKELKPITLFGGFLGMVAAVILYFIKTDLNLAPALSLPLSILVYGFIGYLTNVIAIKMIFRPYQEKYLLGLRLPFTPGVVSKEKPRFARALGQFINQELLNGEAVAQLFQNKKSQLKGRFLQVIIKNDYQLIKKFLSNHRQQLARNITEQLLKKRKQFAFWLANHLYHRPLSSINLSRASLERLKIEHNDHLISCWGQGLSQLLNSQHKPADFTANQKTELLLKKGIEKLLRGELAKLVKTLEKGELGEHLNQRSQAKLAGILDKRINQLISAAEIKRIKRVLQQSLLASFQDETTIEKIAQVISQQGFNQFTAHKKLKELLSAHGKGLSPAITGQVIQRGLELLTAERQAIKSHLSKLIRQKMGIWYPAGKLVEIDVTLARITDNFLDQQLPLFLHHQQHELEKISSSFLERVGENSLQALGIELNFEQLKAIMIKLSASETFRQKLANLSSLLINITTRLKLKTIFKILPFPPPDILASYIVKEINSRQKELAVKIDRNITELIKPLAELITKILEHSFRQTEVSSFTEGIDEEELARSMKNTMELLLVNNPHLPLIKSYVAMIATKLEKKGLSAYFKEEYWQDDLLTFVEQLAAEPGFTRKVATTVQGVIMKITDNFTAIFRSETLYFSFEVLITSLIDSIQQYFLEIISSINTAKITARQIEEMDAGKIEQLFYSFAGSYLYQLEAYGWLGSIIGLFISILIP